ncbi:cytochrome d ubiquinol oxidase subunit II [uncultured Umboniibacter sp.]|uniref:cytochrome d ubiquinol oxidase subunit II n=1 Tax=uncultured Umboniibacter sp. TaxID=1798917 RepID=UPI00262A99E0|nr:cytochrome d ubiquinol oxidase subunit II [uncultured Umboniibacter sp.]
MIDFSSWLNLPLIWGAIIGIAVFLYVVLDGFDLGCGILFPFAPSDKCRSRMMNSIAPFWDGNETWLVLGGGGLFVAFPLAYAILLPALYLPITLMLMGLIFRGVAFEFRFKAGERDRKLWDIAFHGGSLLATFMQGVVLGNFIQGIDVEGRQFSGGALDWANGFAIVTGIALVFGYALLGATWLVMKTEDETQAWARSAAKYVLSFVALAMLVVSISMLFIDTRIVELWFSSPNIFFLAPIPLLTIMAFILLGRDLFKGDREVRPFLLSQVIFLLGYIGFLISLYPWIVPFEFTLWEAAAVSTSQTITLIGTVIMLPIILGYTGYCYYIFRGKSSHESMY